MQGLTDRVVIVAGAATGIGAATLLRLADAGAKVAIGDLNLAAAEELAKRICAAGGNAIAIFYDQGDESSVAKLVFETVDHFGVLHGVHANAADIRPQIIGRDRDVADMDVVVWEQTMRVNLIGYATIIRSALPHLLASGGGSIVCTSSGAAARGLDTIPAYAASKAGVNALCRHVASRWGVEGIRCNPVAPGVIMTDAARATVTEKTLEDIRAKTPSPRLGTPDDVASAVAYPPASNRHRRALTERRDLTGVVAEPVTAVARGDGGGGNLRDRSLLRLAFRGCGLGQWSGMECEWRPRSARLGIRKSPLSRSPIRFQRHPRQFDCRTVPDYYSKGYYRLSHVAFLGALSAGRARCQMRTHSWWFRRTRISVRY
jgi:NAD(P)-dependent dehydrogenase (short-subunit alcohol dehydrogenase family)